ncbi:beta strand repeat-containing protein [Prosthecobacter sp.]
MPAPVAWLLVWLILPLFSPSLMAANLTWDADGTAGGATGGSGLWDTTSLLWNNAGTMSAWTNTGHVAVFGGTAGTVTLDTAITAAGLTFSSTGYTLAGDGNTLSLGGSVTVPNASHSALIQANMTVTSALSLAIVGNVTLDAGYEINAAGFSFGKSGAGRLTMASSVTNAGVLAISAGIMDLSGSYVAGTYGPGLSVSGGTLNVSGTLGSPTIPTGQSAFFGNSVTNFSGTAYISGGSSTFRIGDPSPATVNITAGSVTVGTSSGGLAVGRSGVNGQGTLNISGGSLLVTANANVVRVGAGYSDAETAGAGASVITLSGTGLLDTLTTTGSILLGSNVAGNTQGTGTLNLNGGTLATGRSITGGSVGASVFNFNGGTLKANAATMTLSTTLGTVNVRDGGAVIDTNGFNITIAEALRHSDIGGDTAIDGGLTKKGNGTLTLSGTEASSFTGITRIHAGELALSKTAGISAIVGDITLGDGTTAAVLRLVNADQIADTSNITLNGTDASAGIFRLNGRAETLGGLISTGGAGFVENESATSAILTLNNTGTQAFSGILRNGTLAGTLSLVKNGAGTQILSGQNTHTGSTTINAGTLQFGTANALNATTAINMIAAGGLATLALDGNAWTPGVITFYGAASTATSQAVINLGTGGLLTLGSTVTLNNTNNPLGALITGGTLDLGAATRTFAIADSGNAVADLTIASTITTGTGVGLTKTNAGTLRLTGNATLGSTVTISGGVLEAAGTVTNSAAAASTSVGSVATPGVLRITSGGDYSTTTLSVGAAAGFRGALVMQGGTLTLTTPNTQAGVLLGATGYGGMFVSGGTVNTNRVDSGDGTTAASISVLQVSGGTLNTARYIMFRNERWEFTVTGGEVVRTGEYIALAFRSGGTAGTATPTAQGVMTVAGGMVNNGIFHVTIGQQNDGSALGAAHINLNAGTLINNQIILYNNTGTANKGVVNFNGGTLKSSASTSLVTTSSSGGTSTLATYVNGAFGSFAGGAVIDTNGFNPTLATALLAPTGEGVSSIPVTSGGSGYIGAPYVEISGGGGSGATASATVDLDPTSATYGQITGIVITNPGRDYTSAPTVTLLGGGGTGAATGTITTVANTSGGLTKLGAGTLTLSGATANTYTGLTSVQAGQLDLSKTAGVTAIAGDVSLGTGAAPAVLRLVNSDQIADSSVVTFSGSGANAGTFRLNNRNETLGGLASSGGAGLVENESGSAATSTLTVNVASGTQTYSGVVRNGDGAGTDGTLALTKSGLGTQVLSGVNTHTGATLVTAGTLQISAGGTTGSGAVTVQSGGTLQGAGSIRGSSFTAASGAFVIAGDGSLQGDYGTLAFTPVTGSGSIDFQSGSTVTLGINPGGTSDLLNIVGTGSNTLLFNGNLTITAPLAFTPVSTEVFNLLDWTGLVSAPTFASRFTSAGLLLGNGDEAAGLDLPDISGSGYYWDISSFTTNGTIAIIVPEPSRVALVGIAWAGLVIRRRKVRRQAQ